MSVVHSAVPITLGLTTICELLLVSVNALTCCVLVFPSGHSTTLGRLAPRRDLVYRPHPVSFGLSVCSGCQLEQVKIRYLIHSLGTSHQLRVHQQLYSELALG